ncbi:hypothetical protein Tco_0850406 [Tanacetum coccineum]
MEEYIRLEEERALSRGKTFDWQTARFGRMEHYYKEECFTNIEAEFPAIIFGNTNAFSSQTSLGTTMEEYEAEKEDSELEFPAIVLNDTSTSDTTPSWSNFDDLDYYNDFKNEFPTIIYDDGLTSKSDPVIEPSENSQTNDENETSLSKCDKKEQNALNRNNLLPFCKIYPDNSKSDRDNDDEKKQSSENNTKGSYGLLKISLNKISENFNVRDFIMELNVYVMAWNHIDNEIPLRLFKNLYVPFGIPFDPKQYYKDGAHTNLAVAKVVGYTEDIVRNFEQSLGTIWDRSVNRVHILDFKGLTLEMR